MNKKFVCFTILVSSTAIIIALLFYFSEIENISPTELHTKLDSDSFQIIDARQKIEFEVSRIPYAMNLPYNEDDDLFITTINQFKKDTIFVVYCSVGIRSTIAAKKIKKLGFQTLNLSGGIFEWSNKNFPLVTPAGKRTEKIHGYNWLWSLLIERHKVVL